MLKRLSCLLMALVLMLTPLASINVSASVASDAANGVVRVYSSFFDSSEDGIGTAFGIGTIGEETDLFVTNLHVVSYINDQGSRTFANRVYIVIDSSSLKVNYYRYTGDSTVYYDLDADTANMVLCDVIGYIDGYDLAILRATKPVSGRVALEIADRGATESTVSQGDTVYALGFPANSDVILNQTDWSYNSDGIEQKTLTYSSLVSDVTSTRGSVSKFSTIASENNTKAIQIDVEISGGNSGGPLINEDGVVVGINTSGSTTTNLNFAVYSDYIWQIADTCGVADEINIGGSSSVNIGLIVGLVIAAVVIVVLIVVIVMIQNSTKKQKVEPPVVVQPPVQPPVQGPTTPTQPVESGFPEGPRVQAVTGALLGKRYPITGTLRIGRNPGNNEIVIPAPADGVSGIHCQLSLSNGQILLTDLGSTYGTYLNDIRITANQPMVVTYGDVFYLGSKNVTFEIVKKGGAK